MLTRRRQSKKRSGYYSPIDPRLVPDIFSFSHVRGFARIFLTVEMVLSTLMVLATSVIVILSVTS